MSCQGCPGNIDPLIITSPVTTGPQGPQGPQGIAGPPGPVGPAGLTWKGAWSNTGIYVLNDAVGFGGASYFCIAPVGPSATTPPSDPTKWALLAAQGATGQQGVQGSQGAQGMPGTNGTSAYVYIGFATDVAGTNFNTSRTAGGIDRCYMNVLTSTAAIVSLTAGSFVVGGSVTYVTGWVNLCSETGTVPASGTFTSGSTNPVGSGTAGDIYLNTTSAIFFYYTGGQWDAIPNAYPITALQNITLPGSYIAGSRTPRYRQIGVTVKTRGSLSTFGGAVLETTDVQLYQYPVYYRPLVDKYLPVFDSYTGVWGTVKVGTNGVVTLLGTKTPVYVDNLSLDTIEFELV